MRSSQLYALTRIICSLGACLLCGCTALDYKGPDYVPAESVYTRAGDGNPVTDVIVLGYADDVAEFLEIRMHQKRSLRRISSGIQVSSAAAATALAAFQASSRIVASLAGVSAIIPEVKSILQAKEGAEAFRRGGELVRNAMVAYTVESEGVTNGAKLTPGGAKLLSQTTAAVHLVYKALMQQIPTAAEVSAAET